MGHLWDTGANAADELNRIMKLRAAALKNFSAAKIRFGAPMSTLEEVLVPVYMFHRYQTEAAAKLVGGLNYAYAVRGDLQPVADIVPAGEQRRALDALLTTLNPAALAVPGVGFGYGEEVNFVESRNLKVTDDGIQVRVAVYLPASDDALPVQVEVASRVVGLLAPSGAEGSAKAWVRVKTRL